MAQPIFDEHPLELYLRDAGETPELMPGGASDFALTTASTSNPPSCVRLLNYVPAPLVALFQNLHSAIQQHAHQQEHPPQGPSSRANHFAERFKYDVISSSLLSTTSPAAPHLHQHQHQHQNSHARTTSIPGRLSRGTSVESDHPPTDDQVQSSHPNTCTRPILVPDLQYSPATLGAGICVVVFGAGHYVLALLALCVTAVYVWVSASVEGIHVEENRVVKKDYVTPTLDALNELIAASDNWDSVVHEAIAILESEERTFYSPHTTPSRPSYSSHSPLPPLSHSPSSSPLRIALHSSFHTTHTQCDNVRTLLSALTAPAELAQLAEMYAPPSPAPGRPVFSTDYNKFGYGGGNGNRNGNGFGVEMHPRPLSLPSRTAAAATERENVNNKRSTWNGAYSTLGNGHMRSISQTPSQSQSQSQPQSQFAQTQVHVPAMHPSPTALLLRRREKRRSDLSALISLPPSSPSAASVSTPASAPATAVLYGVKEEEQSSDLDLTQDMSQDEDVPESSSTFGTAALALRRQHINSGLDALHPRTPPPVPAPTPYPIQHPQPAPASLPSTPRFQTFPLSFPRASPHQRFSLGPASASRFTTLQHTPPAAAARTSYTALLGALGARRYACAHLLALRFDEGDEGSIRDADDHSDEDRDGDGGHGERGSDGDGDSDGYWEDVRAVMGLLASTLGDAAARLSEALEDAEAARLREGNASPVPDRSRSASPSPVRPSTLLLQTGALPPFARTSSLFSSSLLSSASASVSSTTTMFAPAPTHLARFAAHVDAVASALGAARGELEACVDAVRRGEAAGGGVEAYERLRRELGLALRECERGRERLVEMCRTTADGAARDGGNGRHGGDGEGEGEEGDEADDLPALAHDASGSDESDKPEMASPVFDIGFQERADAVVVNGAGEDFVRGRVRVGADAEDTVPQGIEEVFEADTEAASAWKRERSKLTREERIRLAKVRRESVDGGGRREGAAQQEVWGPGGDVVQELKDVIWQVGEKRRRMTQVQTQVQT